MNEYESAASAGRVTVVGAGTIGASWTAFFLSRGLEVLVFDPDEAAEERVGRAVTDAWPQLERLGLFPGAAPDRWRLHTDLGTALADTGFVQENVPEIFDLKADTLRRIGELTPAGVIVASSTSGLAMSALQDGCRHPSRYVVGHPFHPPHLTPAIEVVAGAATDPRAVEAAMAFYERLGKVPVHIRKEVPGHLVSRLQSALWREAVSVVARGIATMEDVDKAIANGPGLRWALNGPGAVHHMAGGAGGIEYFMQHLHPAMQSWWPDLGEPVVDEALRRKLIEQIRQEVGEAPTAELARSRDEALVRILKAREGYGPYRRPARETTD